MSVRQEDKAFIATLYKYMFVGLMLDWIKSDMKGDPALMVERLEQVIHGSVSRRARAAADGQAAFIQTRRNDKILYSSTPRDKFFITGRFLPIVLFFKSAVCFPHQKET